MNKKDLPIIIGLFMLLVLWGPFSQRLFPQKAVPTPTPGTNVVATADSSNAVPEQITHGATSAPPEQVPDLEKPPVSPPVSRPPVDRTDEPSGPQWRNAGESSQHAGDRPVLVKLSNELLNLTISSWGGCIVSASLVEYTETNSPDSGPMTFDFASLPALAYVALPGLSTDYDFELSGHGRAATISRTSESGIRLVRTIELSEKSYDIKVIDRIENTSGASISLPTHGMHLGRMGKIGTTSRRGMPNLNIDTKSAEADRKIRHWAQKRFLSSEIDLATSFQEESRRTGGCQMNKAKMTVPLPEEIHRVESGEVDWLAVKNKFFVQFLDLPEEEPADIITMHATRAVSSRELANPDNPRSWDSVAALTEVAATAHFGARPLAPGNSFVREMTYYVGPKKHSILKVLDKVDIMELGWRGGTFGWLGWILTWLCPGLLWLMNGIVQVIPNYGIAIIIVTIIMRLVFWPIMQKSTENMKKMQAIQPELQEIREKYKDDQQKLLKHQQALFKEHKVSPLGGCLPMLIQIPVFIGLFRVLRSAVELRFAPFLWIVDLSEPEGLLAGVLPFWPYQLNILPILMTVTMVIQQKMTPTAGDPQQQKMMAVFMPVMMLFLFYNMASALVLYWTTSQLLSILQLVLKNRSDKAKAAIEPAAA